MSCNSTKHKRKEHNLEKLYEPMASNDIPEFKALVTDRCLSMVELYAMPRTYVWSEDFNATYHTGQIDHQFDSIVQWDPKYVE